MGRREKSCNIWKLESMCEIIVRNRPRKAHFSASSGKRLKSTQITLVYHQSLRNFHNRPF